VPGTAVLMADGSYRAIEDIELGDEVLATDPELGITGARPVIDLIPGDGEKNLVEITVDTDGAAGEATGTVIATDGHPFWVDDQGRFVPAAELATDDVVLDADGDLLTVRGVRPFTEVKKVHNLTVDGIHTFYVAVGGATVLTHNCADRAPAGHKYRGGIYKDLKDPATNYKKNVPGTQINHMPPNSINGMPTTAGPAIQMDLADHIKTASWGSFNSAKAHRAAQRALLDKGDTAGAVKMDIDDIRSKFGTKYDDAIVEMLEKYPQKK
jgi:hypothetical protein